VTVTVTAAVTAALTPLSILRPTPPVAPAFAFTFYFIASGGGVPSTTTACRRGGSPGRHIFTRWITR
jgi:hypothetical protein